MRSFRSHSGSADARLSLVRQNRLLRKSQRARKSQRKTIRIIRPCPQQLRTSRPRQRLPSSGSPRSATTLASAKSSLTVMPMRSRASRISQSHTCPQMESSLASRSSSTSAPTITSRTLFWRRRISIKRKSATLVTLCTIARSAQKLTGRRRRT